MGEEGLVLGEGKVRRVGIGEGKVTRRGWYGEGGGKVRRKSWYWGEGVGMGEEGLLLGRERWGRGVGMGQGKVGRKSLVCSPA